MSVLGPLTWWTDSNKTPYQDANDIASFMQRKYVDRAWYDNSREEELTSAQRARNEEHAQVCICFCFDDLVIVRLSFSLWRLCFAARRTPFSPGGCPVGGSSLPSGRVLPFFPRCLYARPFCQRAVVSCLLSTPLAQAEKFQERQKKNAKRNSMMAGGGVGGSSVMSAANPNLYGIVKKNAVGRQRSFSTVARSRTLSIAKQVGGAFRVAAVLMLMVEQKKI